MDGFTTVDFLSSKTYFKRWMTQKNSTTLVDRHSYLRTIVEETIGRDSIVTCKLKMDNWKENTKITQNYRVLVVYENFYKKWWMRCEKKLWHPTMDTNSKKKLCLVIRIVKESAFVAFEGVSLNKEV